MTQHALGLRLGTEFKVISESVELSYQLGITERSRIEISLGYSPHLMNSYSRFSAYYHRVIPLNRFFSCFYGPGAGFGYQHFEVYPDRVVSPGFAILGAQAGVQYLFKDIPLQVAVDIRPEYLAGHAYDKFIFASGLSVRYYLKNQGS